MKKLGDIIESPAGVEYGSEYAYLPTEKYAFGGQVVKISFPPWIFPPCDAQPIDVVGKTTLTASSTDFEVVCSFTVPKNMYARINKYGCVVWELTELSEEVTWRITVNGRTYTGFGSFTCQRGTIIQPAETIILLKETDVIQIEARNAIDSNVFAYAGLWGWYYPKERFLEWT